MWLLPVGDAHAGRGLILERAGEDNPIPSESDINGAMKSVCVCGTHQRVKAAIVRAATGA